MKKLVPESINRHRTSLEVNQHNATLTAVHKIYMQNSGINTLKEKTGYGIVVNTSFNEKGERMVCTPEGAYKCFMRTEMEYLVVNDSF